MEAIPATAADGLAMAAAVQRPAATLVQRLAAGAGAGAGRRMVAADPMVAEAVAITNDILSACCR